MHSQALTKPAVDRLIKCLTEVVIMVATEA